MHQLISQPPPAGREGELIFRTAYHLAGCTKPMKRLWISSMEDSAIREGFDNLRPGSDYDGLHQAALCRQKADWLVGINATRLFSVLYGRTLNIGRVGSANPARCPMHQLISQPPPSMWPSFRAVAPSTLAAIHKITLLFVCVKGA